MHARNRSNPGNGYRSNSVGMGGVATASRVSHETSMRGHGGYNSDYRNYNRGGFGRGQSRHFHKAKTLPQNGGDIFVEAGKLATEYLVSKGLLPANVLSGKWQTDNLKNQVGAQDGDGVQLSLVGRTSALSRLGGAVTDTTPGRRRYPDEYNSMGSRSYMKGRRINGSFKNYGSDWSREFGRSGSLSERSKESVEAEGDSDAFSRHPGEKQVSNDGDSVSQNSPLELAPESDVGGDTESALEKYESVEDAGAKASSSIGDKDLPSEAGVEPLEKADAIKISNAEVGEINETKNIDEKERQETKDAQTIVAGAEEDSLASHNSTDLLKLSSFAKVPTKTRSLVAIRGPKVDTDPMLVDCKMREGEPPKECGHHVEDLTIVSLSANDSSKYYGSKSLGSGDSKVPSAEDELGITYDLGQRNCTTSIPLFNISSVKGEETNELSKFGRANSTMDQSQKRPIDDENSRMGSKKPRESPCLENAQSDGCLRLSDSLEKQQTPQEAMTSKGNAVTLPSDEKRLLDISLYPKGDIEPCMEYTEEKQLFPGSFKTCDLNLMEASDVIENHDNNPILMFPSVTESGKQVVPVDIDLSMSNSSHVPNKYGKCSIDVKDIEVIDLENDSAQEDKDFNNSERTTENVFTGLDGFSNNAHNATDISDAQDGYGLMISELLGNDMPNCSSVPADMNSLHNDMGLHNGEGILGDDDAIYMSLGEIPISFLRVWEQPTQEYGKPF